MILKAITGPSAFLILANLAAFSGYSHLIPELVIIFANLAELQYQEIA